MGNLYRRSSIDASYQVSVHLAKQFQRRILKKKIKKKMREGYDEDLAYQIGLGAMW
jgi:hypothetical protein